DSAKSLLGVEAEKIKGRNVNEVVRKEDLLRFVETTSASEQPIEGEVRIHTPTERILRAHGTTLLDAENQPIGAMVVLHDITQLRRLENVRRDFVANVSHELRTPITSIKGFVETLLDGALDDHENATRFLDIISRHVDRLDRIIEDLLLLSRIELQSDVTLTETSPVGPINEVACSAIELCQKTAEDNNMTIEYDGDTSLMARMNSRLLEQAIVNLLDNAVKYSESDTEIQVRVYRDGTMGVVEVADRGRGIETKHLSRLFERFYRIDKSRSRQLGGTGLGLAIVKHISIAHGGRVEVQSELGAGSTFSIYLPLTVSIEAEDA
ncbi:MAG: ATP-binding protein, partial [Planctomycetia bacterium]